MKKFLALFTQLCLPFVVMSQSISVSPAVASNGQTLDVTITGTDTHFIQGTTTIIGFGFAFPNSINIINDTAIVANVTVPANTFTGDYHVSVNNNNYGSVVLPSGFHVNGLTPPPPKSIVSVSPAIASNGQTLDVTITGKNTTFTSLSGPVKAYFNFSGGSSTLIVNSTTVINDTVVVANTTIPPFAYTQDYDIGIGSHVYKTNCFHVNGIALPDLVSISPAVASNGQTLSVIITGKNTHFSQAAGMSVSFGFGSANSINIINDSSVQVNVTVPAQTYTGNYNVAIYNSIDNSIVLYNSFHVSGINMPSISVNPVCAKPGETLNVTITGGTDAHFIQGSTTVILSVPGYIINSEAIINDYTIIANVSIPLNAIVSDVNENVIIDSYNNTLGLTQIFTAFYIYDSCFSRYTSTYNSTDNKFTLTLDSVTTALGTNFYWDFGDGTTSSNQTPTHVFAQDSVYNVCLKVITAAGDSCDYCHEIGKNNFGEIYRSTGFSLEVLRFVTTDIAQTGKEEKASITVSPNPASDMIVVTTNQLETLSNPILSVYSAEGQLLVQQPVKQTRTELNISNFAKGVYLIKMSSEGQTQVVKFVKE